MIGKVQCIVESLWSRWKRLCLTSTSSTITLCLRVKESCNYICFYCLEKGKKVKHLWWAEKRANVWSSGFKSCCEVEDSFPFPKTKCSDGSFSHLQRWSFGAVSETISLMERLRTTLMTTCFSRANVTSFNWTAAISCHRPSLGLTGILYSTSGHSLSISNSNIKTSKQTYHCLNKWAQIQFIHKVDQLK